MDAVNIAAISDARLTDSSSRTAKMRLSDGATDVIGLECVVLDVALPSVASLRMLSS